MRRQIYKLLRTKLLPMMQSYSHDISSRSSSATLLLACQPFQLLDGTSDDVTIAQGLLNKPNIPRRRSSFTGTSPEWFLPGHSSVPTRRAGPLDNRQSRRAMYSSNTWTTSSGEVPSECDDAEDRIDFLREYNRLAKKVLPPKVKARSIKIDFGNSMVCGCLPSMNTKLSM